MKAIRENSYSHLSTSTLVPVFSREDRKVGTARGWYDSRIATSVNCLTSSSGVSRTESLIAQGHACASTIDLLVIQIDGLRVGDHVLVAAIGIDGAGEKHVLVVALGATENAAMVNCWPTWSSAGCNQTSPTCSSLTEPRR